MPNPNIAHPTHRGLALRAVDVAAGRVPGVDGATHPLSPWHPDSDKLIGQDAAIDEATGLNWMRTPAIASLSGVTPSYVMRVRVIAPGHLLPDEFRAKGYRVGESYYVPATAIAAGEFPPVWDASEGASVVVDGIDPREPQTAEVPLPLKTSPGESAHLPGVSDALRSELAVAKLVATAKRTIADLEASGIAKSTIDDVYLGFARQIGETALGNER